MSCETGLIPGRRSRSAEEKATSLLCVMACKEWALRSLRPYACGEVFCTEPGRSHPCPVRTGPVHEGNSYKMNMHADEKSDEGIRPEKRPNKGDLPPAEAVEERTSPKGNGGQTAAARTLSRDTASNGLAAVRQAARQTRRMYGSPRCCHHITIDLLSKASMLLSGTQRQASMA